MDERGVSERSENRSESTGTEGGEGRKALMGGRIFSFLL